MKITILGAGAWGTALAVQAASRHPVMLWGRDAAQVQRMRTTRCNQRYLDGVLLPEALALESDLQAAFRFAGSDGLLVVATPMSALASMLAALPHAAPVLWLSKGFEAGTARLGHEVARDLAPSTPCGVLSGPSFADEVARGQPTALVAASDDAGLLDRAVRAFHGDALRVYTSADPVGVEVGGAVKNVLAIATGLCDGMQLGLNARAALITRGLAEMTRLGLALGARADTFMGLSGLGDLVLTATGALSRNRRVGLGLAAGQSLSEVLAGLGHVAEGAHSAAMAVRRANALGVEMPIAQAVVEVLDGRASPAAAVQQLMGRDARAESLR